MNHVHCTATAVPPYAYGEEVAIERMKRRVGDNVMRRLAHPVYRQSGIDRRHSVLPDVQPGADPRLLRKRADGTPDGPTTGQRNLVLQRNDPDPARAAPAATHHPIRPAGLILQDRPGLSEGATRRPTAGRAEGDA